MFPECNQSRTLFLNGKIVDVGIQPEDHSGQNKMICIRQARTFSFYVLAIYLKYNYVQHSKRTVQNQDSEMHNLIACMETIHLSHALFIDLKPYPWSTIDIPDCMSFIGLVFNYGLVSHLYIYTVSISRDIFCQKMCIVWQIPCIFDRNR